MHEQSQTNKATRQKQPYNHRSFLQRQHELTEQKGESTTVWSCSNKHKTFVSQGAKDEHVSYSNNTSTLICPL